MSINQCQTGIDDNSDIPPEMFDVERVRLGKKGMICSQKTGILLFTT